MKWIAYNIRRTGDINGRPVHTTRTYGRKSIACNAFFRTYGPYVRVLVHTTRTYGPLKRPVRTGAKTRPYVRAVRTGRKGPYVRVVCTGL